MFKKASKFLLHKVELKKNWGYTVLFWKFLTAFVSFVDTGLYGHAPKNSGELYEFLLKYECRHMALIVMEYRVTHGREALGVMNLILFLQMCLELSTMEMVLEEAVETFEVAIEMVIGLVKGTFKMVQ